jgi:apolipoprotein N-acyltransferase
VQFPVNILEPETTLPPIFSTWPPKLLKISLALGSGLLMGLTVSPINAWYLGWVAIVPLWILVVRQPRAGAIGSALCWGIGYHGWALSWILGVHPMTWMGVPWIYSLAIAIACLTFITLWGTAIVILWASGLNLIGNYIKLSPAVRVVTGTALWCGLEYLWSQSDLWWSTLALTQSPYNLPILHLGQLSGGSTVTAALVAVNGLIAEAILVNWKTQRRSAITLTSAALILLVSGHAIGAVLAQVPLPTPAADALQVGIIQGNIPNEIKLYADGQQQAMTNYTQGYRKLVADKVDVVLTPEGSLPLLPDAIKQSELYEAILEQGIPIWLGAFGDAGQNYTNSLHSIDGQGNFGGRYNKYKLVPLGEYVPFKEVIGKWIKRMSPLQADQLKGAKDQIFDTPFGRAIVGICYESAFGEHFRWQAHQGGEFIITASNNAHYAEAMPAQHHAQDVMRSIETSRWAVRATNTGYSAIVDPHGQTLWQSALHEFVTHSHKIYRLRIQTLYVRIGDWLTLTLLIITGVLLGATHLRRN